MTPADRRALARVLGALRPWSTSPSMCGPAPELGDAGRVGRVTALSPVPMPGRP